MSLNQISLKDQKMVPHAPLKGYFISISNFFILGKHSCLLPTLIYKVFGTWEMLLSILPLLLCGNNDIWSRNKGLQSIFVFFQVFWRFGSQFTDQGDFLISFIVILSLHFACIVPTWVGHLIWRYSDKFHRTLFYIIIFNHEILMPIIVSWVPSQMGSVISVLVKEKNMANNNNTFYIVQVVIYFLLIVFYHFFNSAFVECDSIYMRGRSICWDWGSNCVLHICIHIGLLTTRLVESLTIYPSIVFAVLSAFNYINMVRFILKHQIFVNVHTNIWTSALTISFFIGFVMQVISMYISRLDTMIVIVVIVLTYVIMYFIITKYIHERISVANSVLYSIENDESLFTQLLNSPSAFLRVSRIGFQNGHRFIFTWRPFILANQLWPKSKKIIAQYVKLVAIYYDEDPKLESILNLMKKFRDFPTSQLRREIKSIRESRDIHLTRALKTKLKNVDERVKLVNNLIVSFWNSVEDNNPNSSFDIALKLSKIIEHVHSDFIRYSYSSPNNWVIPSQYANFLMNVICDPEEGHYWTKRFRFLRGKKTMLYDAAQTCGFGIFPYIPRSLSPNQESENADIMATTQSANSCTMSSTGSNEVDKSSETNHTDEMDAASLGILKVGDKSKVSFVIWPLVVTILFFIIAFIVVPFTPEGLFKTATIRLKDTYDVVIGASDISSEFSIIGYFLMENALQSEKLIPSDAGVELILNTTLTDGNILLDAEIEKLNDNIHKVQAKLANLVDIDASSWNFVQDVRVPISSKSSTGIIKNYTSSFLEAINILGSAAYKYSIEDVEPFFKKDWFVFYTENFDQIPFLISKLVDILSFDVADIYDNLLHTIDITFYILGVFEIIILPFFIYLVFRVRSQWKSLISIFNSIPRVAIHKAIKEHTNDMIKESNGSNRNEFRYLSTFAQMVVSRDTTSGVPVMMIICFGLFNFVLSIASCFIFDLIIRSNSDKFKAVSLTYFYSRDACSLYFFVSELILRNIAVNIRRPFQNDTIASIKTAFDGVSESLKYSATNILATTWNDIQVGFAVTNNEIVNEFLRIRGDWNNQHTEYDKITRIPAFLTLNIIQGQLNDLFLDSMNSSISNGMRGSDKLWTKLRTVSNYLMPGILDSVLELEGQLMNRTVGDIEFYLILISVLMLAVGCLTISSVLFKLYQVQRAVKFALSALSMIDHNVIQDMPSIMNIFSGKITKIAESNRTLQSTYEAVDAAINESVIQLDANLVIVSLNNDFAKNWQIDPELFIGVPIKEVVIFSSPSIQNENVANIHTPLLSSRAHRPASDELKDSDGSNYEEDENDADPSHQHHHPSIKDESLNIFRKLELQASKEIKESQIHFETTMKVRSVNVNEFRHVSFNSIRVDRENMTKLIIFFNILDNRSQKLQNIHELTDITTSMKNSVIPFKIQHRINPTTNKLRYMPRFVVLVAVEILNYSDFCWKHNPKEAKIFFRNFKDFIAKQCDTPGADAVTLKIVGAIFIIGFNFNLQIANYYSAAFEAFAMTKTIAKFSKENGYDTRFSLTHVKKSLMRLSTNNTFRLDLYTKKTRHLLKLLTKIQKNSLIFGPKVHDILPEDVKAKTTSIKYLGDSKKTMFAKLINLDDFI